MDLSDAAKRLQEIEKNGRVTPEEVVEDARDPASPLHSHFEWDDAEAAHQHRLGQAALLISRVRLEVTHRGIPIHAPMFVRDPGETGVYRSILSVRKEDDTSRRVIVNEMMRVVAAAKRARSIALILGTGEDVTEIIRLAESVIRQARATDAPTGIA